MVNGLPFQDVLGGTLGREQILSRIISLPECGVKLSAEEILQMSPEDRPRELDHYRSNGYIIIDPPIDKGRLDPDLPSCLVSQSSLDVEMGDACRVYCPPDGGPDATVLRPSDKASLELFERQCTELKSIGSDGYRLRPGEFILARTQRYYFLPTQIQAHIWGRSRVARCGVEIHLTAPRIDPGFAGQIVLEICNHNMVPVMLEPGFEIAQLEFQRVFGGTGKGYADSKPQLHSRQGLMKHALAPDPREAENGMGLGEFSEEALLMLLEKTPWLDGPKL